ncbi:MAG: efflux RND transporter periplasmic adaptor subunit [Deltaproteobacteria bacterium]|nr:efflux RND transporter periplasmic adaptor subunit [Deltaproteobacteria bacterium]
MMWRVCPLALSLSLILAAAAGCKHAASEEKVAPVATESTTPAPATSAKPVDPSEAEPGVYEVASVANPIRVSRLSFKGGGILRTLKVREGDKLKAGQLIAVIDATDVSIRAQSAAVAHAQALEGVKNAKSDLERVQILYDAGALPDQTIEKAELAMRVADLQVQAARVGMRMANQMVTDTSLAAPFSGVVTKVLAEEGQMITSMPPVIVCILADVDTLELKVPIPERRLAAVKVGTPVLVVLPAINQEKPAKIDRIAEVIDPMTRSAEAVIRIPNKDHALPAGLYARVRFPSLPSDLDEAPAKSPDAGAKPRTEGGR